MILILIGATISLYDKAALSYIHLMVQSLRDDSLFELAQGNTLLFYFNSKAILNSGPFHTLSFYIPHAKASSQLQNYSNNGRTLISICPEHKIHIKIEEKHMNGKIFYNNFISTYTSMKEGHMRHGSAPAYQHRDSAEFATCLTPVFVKKTDAPNDIITFFKNLFQIENINFQNENVTLVKIVLFLILMLLNKQ